MKGLKFCALVLSAGMLLSSCGGNMNNTGKGSLIGAGGGAALGTLIGTLASSNKGKGAGISSERKWIKPKLRLNKWKTRKWKA